MWELGEEYVVVMDRGEQKRRWRGKLRGVAGDFVFIDVGEDRLIAVPTSAIAWIEKARDTPKAGYESL